MVVDERGSARGSEQCPCAGRPSSRTSHGPGFLEIVSGPGPLNALYVSCNLIPRRSVRCSAVSRSESNLREFLIPGHPGLCAIIPSGLLLTPDATVVSLLPLSRNIRHSSSRTSTIDSHQEDGVRVHSIVLPILRVNKCKF